MKQQIFNILVGLISIVALFFSLLKITPYEVTSETYIGIIVSALSIATTLIIGYQIYNIIEIKKELKLFNKKAQQQNSQYRNIVKKNAELESKLRIQDSLLQGGLDAINANFEQNKGNTKASFYFNHRSLIFYLQSDLNNFQTIFNSMRENIISFTMQSFTMGYTTNENGELINPDIISDIKAYIGMIHSNENIIRKQPNFTIIQTEYDRVMKHFYKRIEDIKRNPQMQLSDLEKNNILNPS